MLLAFLAASCATPVEQSIDGRPDPAVPDSIVSEEARSEDPLIVDNSEAPAPTQGTGAASDSPIEPIDGYGDFSHLSYSEIDWIEVTWLQVACANDHGVPVDLIPPGDGIGFANVAVDQHRTARAVLQACLLGLNLPAYEPLSEGELIDLFDKLLDLKRCLEEEGIQVANPPSVDSFVEEYYSEDVWHPYDSVPNLEHSQWHALNETCPQP